MELLLFLRKADGEYRDDRGDTIAEAMKPCLSEARTSFSRVISTIS